MPFRSVATLPQRVKDALPAQAERIFLRAFNAAFDKFNSESRAFRIAWGAVGNAGFERQPNGKWIKVRKDSKEIPIVKRFDFGSIGSKIKVTPQGYLKIPANLTRTGVFVYTKADGTKTREYRPPEEVFSDKSIETLKGAPVTDLHPSDNGAPVLVSTRNHKRFSVGIVNDSIKTDGKFVSATLTVMDEDIIAAIQQGDRKEISLGYNCRVDFIGGITPEGEKYDAIQRDITYNHAAIGPINWGRAGNKVALKLDGGDAVIESHYYNNEEEEVKIMENTNISMKIDGVDYELPKQTAQAIQKTLDESAKSLKDATTKIDSLQAKTDSLTEELENEKNLRSDENDVSKLDSLVQERLSLVEKAKKLLGDEYKFDGKNKLEIIKDAVHKSYPNRKFDEKSDDYYAASFDIAVENNEAHKTDSLEEVAKVADSAMKTDNNTTWDPYAAADARKKEMSELWKTPLNGNKE